MIKLRILIISILMQFPNILWAEKLWLEGAVSGGAADGDRLSVMRTAENYGFKGVTAGLSHHRVEQSDWNLLEIGYNKRVNQKFVALSQIQVGPGKFAGNNFIYNKYKIGGVWISSRQWSSEITDTYIDVVDTVGHLLGGSLTHNFSFGMSVSLSGNSSIGSRIDSRQIGANFKLHRQYIWMAGVYFGETSNPVTITGLGPNSSSNDIKSKQAYLGINVPVGKYSIMGVMDYLKLGDSTRREFSLVLKIPLPGRSKES